MPQFVRGTPGMFGMAHSASSSKLTAPIEPERAPFEILHATAVRNKKDEDRDEHVEKGDMSFFVVADGHGGAQVADLAKSDMLMSIITRAADVPLQDAMHAVFLELHARARRVNWAERAGTTATVVAIDRRTRWITCANVGDSLGYLVLPEKLVPLGVDHRFDTNVDERQRVVGQGAKIGRAMHVATGQPSGPLRAFPGGLAMGRSIGDLDCGEWVNAAPSVQQVQIPPQGGWVVICSDGVWDAIDAEAVGRIVREAPNPAAAAEKVAPTQTRIRASVPPCLRLPVLTLLLLLLNLTLTLTLRLPLLLARKKPSPPKTERQLGTVINSSNTPHSGRSQVVAAALKARGLRDDITCTVAAIGAAIGRRKTASFARHKMGKLLRNGTSRSADLYIDDTSSGSLASVLLSPALPAISMFWPQA